MLKTHVHTPHARMKRHAHAPPPPPKKREREKNAWTCEGHPQSYPQSLRSVQFNVQFLKGWGNWLGEGGGESLGFPSHGRLQQLTLKTSFFNFFYWPPCSGNCWRPLRESERGPPGGGLSGEVLFLLVPPPHPPPHTHTPPSPATRDG